MKTPHAILIGLSLIAAAIFFKDTAVKPAHAFGGPDGITCYTQTNCWLIDGDKAYEFWLYNGSGKPRYIVNWRTGERIK